MEIEVRVADRSGQTVADLLKEDFQLLENGQPQVISTFEFVSVPGLSDAVTAGAPAEVTPPEAPDQASSEVARSTFVYIATRGRREDRKLIFEAVSDFVDENVVPGVLVSIEGSPFTSSRSALHERLGEMLARGSRTGGQASFVDTLAVDLARDIEYSDSFEDLMEDLNEEFSDELESIAAADRAALYRRLRMYEYIDLIRALSVYPGRKVVVLFATGLPVDADNIDVMDVLQDEATRARVRFYVSDVSRLEATPPGGDAEARVNVASLIGDPQNNGFQMQAEQRQDSQDGLYELASRTGGRAVLNSNDFGEVFDVVRRESGDFYLLGYYPADTEQKGRLRRIRVKVDRPGLRIRHQAGYYEERPFQRMSRSERNLRMHQALAFDTPYTDLPVRADLELFLNSAGSPSLVYAVGLHARDIPSAQAKKGTEVKLTVVAQASADRGEGVPPQRPVIDERRFQMRLDTEALEKLRNDPHSWLHYGSQMPLAPGEYDWKVVVRDDHSGALGSYQTRLRIPPSTDLLKASSLLLTGRVDDVSGRKAPKRGRPGHEDVLTVAGTRFFATANKSFRKGNAIYLLYDAYNPGADLLADPPPARLALYRGNEPVPELPVSDHQTVAQPEASRIRYLAALATAELDAGEYVIAAMIPSETAERRVIYQKFRIVESEPM